MKPAAKKTSSKKSQDKSSDLLAKELISGKLGDDQEAREALGDRFDEVKEKAEVLLKPASWIGIVDTIKGPLRVRKAPNFEGEVLRLIDKGSEVELTGSDQGGWYKLADGSGYVKADLIIKK